MHLAEIMELRPVPAAGLLMALTRRCPLSCAHCSTESSATAEQFAGAPFLRLARTFTADEHPSVIVMSGGEALLRPKLVSELATTARQSGTRSYLLSGMFFARHQRRRPPDQIMRAITTVDHFAASLDAFHEREVSRADVFHAMHSIMEEVPAVSFQLTGSPGDAYLTELVDDIRREFADRVPILVTPLQPTGRAAELLTVRPLPPDPPSVAPCTVATWPLVGYDGTVYACSRQSLVEPAKPPHLVLGDAAVDSWAEVRKRSLQHPAVRAVRLLGPRLVREKFGRGAQEGGACTTCVAMGGEADEVAHRAGAYLNSPRGALVERLATQLTGRVSARESALACGAAHHASLVELGRSVSR